MNRFVKYGLVYAGTSIALGIFGWLAITFFNFDLPTGAYTVLPAIMAAMVCGQNYAREHKEAYPKSSAWRHAVQYTGIALIISVLMFAGNALVSPEILQVFGLLPQTWFMGIVLFMLFLTFLIHRYFLGAGAKIVLKTLE